jgi:hypothetical protein
MKQQRLSMTENGAPLAGGRAAHADEGMQCELSMNSCAFMNDA